MTAKSATHLLTVSQYDWVSGNFAELCVVLHSLQKILELEEDYRTIHEVWYIQVYIKCKDWQHRQSVKNKVESNLKIYFNWLFNFSEPLWLDCEIRYLGFPFDITRVTIMRYINVTPKQKYVVTSCVIVDRYWRWKVR